MTNSRRTSRDPAVEKHCSRQPQHRTTPCLVNTRVHTIEQNGVYLYNHGDQCNYSVLTAVHSSYLIFCAWFIS